MEKTFNKSFLLAPYLNKQTKDKPALVISPASSEPKLILLKQYNCANTTVITQLGIKPNRAVTNGWKILLVNNIF